MAATIAHMDADQLNREIVAATEGTGRLVNELVVFELPADASPVRVRCECGNDACKLPLSLPREAYEHVRSDPMTFAVLPGHELPETEDVVEHHDGYDVVRKFEAVRPLVEASNPRR